MSIPPWSHSKIESFRTCPRKFNYEYVETHPKEPDSEAQIYGKRVHTAFEEFQRDGTALPGWLGNHQPFMNQLRDARIKLIGVERKVALNKKLQPCDFFAPDVWWRGVIDYQADTSLDHCQIVDYKTGKVHSKMGQLHEYAVYAFAEGYKSCEVMYYWTKTGMATPKMTVKSDRMMPIIKGLIPDLKQYVEAFKTDIWQPRPCGLCRGWCPVEECEHWEPRAR